MGLLSKHIGQGFIVWETPRFQRDTSGIEARDGGGSSDGETEEGDLVCVNQFYRLEF